MKVNITVARPDIIPDIWDVAYPLMKGAIDVDIFQTEKTIKDKLTGDTALLFLATVDGAIKGAVVVQIEECSSKVVHVLALGGKDFKQWQAAMQEALNKYAYFMECKLIASLGVRAWKRLIPDYTEGRTLFYKEVQPCLQA